jgi:hypothetical protein
MLFIFPSNLITQFWFGFQSIEIKYTE